MRETFQRNCSAKGRKLTGEKNSKNGVVKQLERISTPGTRSGQVRRDGRFKSQESDSKKCYEIAEKRDEGGRRFDNDDSRTSQQRHNTFTILLISIVSVHVQLAV